MNDSRLIPRLDICEGDFVQVRWNNPKFAGKVGVVIGIKVEGSKDCLSYTVKFSDKSSHIYSSDALVLVRSCDSIPAEER